LFADLILIVSETSLTLMLVVLGVLFIGISYGGFAKSKERILLHRWSMSVTVVLAIGVILLVMLPSAFNFYVDPNLQFFSSLSIITFIHAVAGVFAITLGLIYALGDLPQKVKQWMRWAAIFWAISLGLGLFVFLEMMGFLPF
jgi:uncharacterized membrane protein YozB (DUF420 family)